MQESLQKNQQFHCQKEDFQVGQKVNQEDFLYKRIATKSFFQKIRKNVIVYFSLCVDSIDSLTHLVYHFELQINSDFLE